ncbi:hypothetical protein EYF80_033814 [Liparis tanakae]|uniref:Uncharacterized protein n=1 Tax=Liparis tanakae TaxID=230148 RepID=A0A4Z2GRF4_9TELE|nr:hypothetical protein EYF80_033814 [Liparis tanakae]
MPTRRTHLMLMAKRSASAVLSLMRPYLPPRGVRVALQQLDEISRLETERRLARRGRRAVVCSSAVCTHMAIPNCSIHFLFVSSVLQKNWKPCFPCRWIR